MELNDHTNYHLLLINISETFILLISDSIYIYVLYYVVLKLN